MKVVINIFSSVFLIKIIFLNIAAYAVGNDCGDAFDRLLQEIVKESQKQDLEVTDQSFTQEFVGSLREKIINGTVTEKDLITVDAVIEKFNARLMRNPQIIREKMVKHMQAFISKNEALITSILFEDTGQYDLYLFVRTLELVLQNTNENASLVEYERRAELEFIAKIFTKIVFYIEKNYNKKDTQIALFGAVLKKNFPNLEVLPAYKFLWSMYHRFEKEKILSAKDLEDVYMSMYMFTKKGVDFTR